MNYFKKNLLAFSLLASTLIYGKLANASDLKLIRKCTTFDFSYNIYILQDSSNSYFLAAIFDSKDNIIAKYDVEEKFVGSESQGRKHFIDKNTKGMNFDFSEPSHHFKNFSLSALLEQGQSIEDNSIDCK